MANDTRPDYSDRKHDFSSQASTAGAALKLYEYEALDSA
jgi:hypothetical protein